MQSRHLRDNIDLDESEEMNQDQQALFLNISRSKSSDSFLGKLLPHPNDMPQRSLVWEPPLFQHQQNIIITQQPPQQDGKPLSGKEGLHVFKKIKKEKVRSKCDYDKNICGYVTKKVIREFLGTTYEKQVQQLMEKYHCRLTDCKSFYLRKVESITGPSHLPELFNAYPHETPELESCKSAFRQFYDWFLRERYIRHLLLEGKMTNKQAYISYKNTHLFKFVQKKPQAQPQPLQVPTFLNTRSRSARSQQLKQEGRQQQEMLIE